MRSHLTNRALTVTRDDLAAQTEPFGAERKNDCRNILSTNLIEFKSCPRTEVDKLPGR